MLRGSASGEETTEAESGLEPKQAVRRTRRWALASAATGATGAVPWLASCGAAGTQQALPAAKPASITGWQHNNKTYAAWIEPQVDLFRAAYPQIKVTLEPTGTQEKVQAALAAGDPPDFQWANDAQLYLWAKANALEPVEAYLDKRGKGDFFDFARAAVSINGKMWGWPWMMNPTGMLINKTLYEQRGLTNVLPKPGEKADWSFDQWKAAIRAVSTRSGDTEKDVYGTAYGSGTAVYWDMMILWGNGAELYDPDEKKVIACSKEGIDGLQMIVDLIKDRQTPPNVDTILTKDQVELFANKRLGVFNSSTGQLLDYRKRVQDGNIVGTFDPYFMPPPHAPGKKPAAFVAVPNMQVFKREKDMDRTRAAQALGAFMIDTAQQRAIKPLGTHPVRRSVGNLYPDDVSMTTAMTILDNGRGVGRFPGIDDIRALWGPMTKAAYTGQKSPSEALNEFCRLAEPIMAKLTK